MICDCCDEEWEESFFCKVCSDTPTLEEALTPLTEFEWDYVGPDCEMREAEVYRTVCLNCCMGHK